MASRKKKGGGLTAAGNHQLQPKAGLAGLGGAFAVRYNEEATFVAGGYGDGTVVLYDLKKSKQKAVGKPFERGRVPCTVLRFRPKTFMPGTEQANSRIKDMFDLIDADGSGEIDKEEMAEAAWVIKGDIGAEDMTDAELQEAIARMDEDDNGGVDFDEFAAWWRSEVTAAEPQSEKAQAVFGCNAVAYAAKGAAGTAEAALARVMAQPIPAKNFEKEALEQEKTRAQAKFDLLATASKGAADIAMMAASAWTGGMLLTAGCAGIVQHWEVEPGKLPAALMTGKETTKDGVNQVYCAEFSPDGCTLATGGVDFAIRLYDEETKRLCATFAQTLRKSTHSLGHSNRVYGMRFIDDSTLISGGWGDSVEIWDIRVGKPVRTIHGPHLSGDSLDVTGVGGTILTGSARGDDPLQLWDMGQGTLIKTLPWENPSVSIYCAAFRPGTDGTQVVAAGSRAGAGTTSTLKLFDTVTDECKLQDDFGAVTCMHFRQDGNQLALGCGDSQIRLIDTSAC